MSGFTAAPRRAKALHNTAAEPVVYVCTLIVPCLSLFNRVNVILQKVTYVDMYAYIMLLDAYGSNTKESAWLIHRPLQIRIRFKGLFFHFLFQLYRAIKQYD